MIGNILLKSHFINPEINQIIYLYFHKINNIYDHEIHGRIIAVIAINQEANIVIKLFGVFITVDQVII